jgi:hypothetical protein
MKKSGEQKNSVEYLKSASSIIEMVNRCERFESYSGGADSRMLFLFFALLPKAYRKDVEVKGLELVFEESSLGESCKDNMVGSELAALRSSMGRLMHSLWCRTADIPLPVEEYLRKARDLLDKLHNIRGISSSSLVSAYLKLVPSRYQNPTRALAAEISASKNISMLKKADKLNVGENSVDPARFKSAPIKLEQKPPPLKRKLDAPFVAPRSTETTNPYTRKKKPAAVEQKSASENQNRSLTAYLKSVESDAYVKETSRDLVKKFQTDVPNDIVCPICDSTCTEPFIADCGHVACLLCWLGWLNKSKSCMTCRGKATKESIARLVYEKNADATARKTPLQPNSLPAPEDDSDDELEIC